MKLSVATKDELRDRRKDLILRQKEWTYEIRKILLARYPVSPRAMRDARDAQAAVLNARGAAPRRLPSVLLLAHPEPLKQFDPVIRNADEYEVEAGPYRTVAASLVVPIMSDRARCPDARGMRGLRRPGPGDPGGQVADLSSG